MNKIFFSFFLLTLSSYALDINKFTNLKSGLTEAKKQNKFAMVFFHGKHCHYCDKLKLTTLKNKDVINYINSKFIFISIEEKNNPDKAKFPLDYIPAIYILDSTTNETKYFTFGYRNSEDFIGEFKTNLN